MMNKLVDLPLTSIKGVGEETGEKLGTLGLFSVHDVLHYFPSRYDDYTSRDLAEVKHEDKVTVSAVVYSAPIVTYYGKKKSRLTFKAMIGNYLITITAFNRHYMKDQIQLHETVFISGKWDKHRQTITMDHLSRTNEQKEIEPVYPLNSSLTMKLLRRIMKQAVQDYVHELDETLTETMMERYKLFSKQMAVKAIHQPLNHEQLKQARRRLIYEEFFYFQLKMQALRKAKREQGKGRGQVYDEEQLAAFIASLPFPLTNAQQRVVDEILTDMKSPYRMNRLLQGDVGSGKTIVAAICAYGTILAGGQAALMVPTEILAEQHAESLTALFAAIGVEVGLLTSSVKGKRRRELLERLANGDVHLLVGTHALIQDEVVFRDLRLVITDEQHRFGVEQRRILREKGLTPDVLFMTATPIPRTLSITVFGEMDVSIINEMPKGRKPIQTYWTKHDLLERVLAFIEKEVVAGRQAYVICPLIEESDKLDVQNAIDVHVMLAQHFRNFGVGLMHGRLSSAEKEEAMRAFSENETQILVSTTVVEVGVNVPNATIMVIYDAERFGLSQLHQLRGRVGRGEHQSYCILLADPKSETGKERMKIMTETTDGFVLSEKDLELRGPGDFFGTKQSGLPTFMIGDMVHDYRVLEVARQDAAKLISSTAFWHDETYAVMRAYLEGSGVLAGDKLD